MNTLKVGHYTNNELGTGLSVFLLPQPAVGAYLLAGSAPASLELPVLDPENSVANLHALVLTGGSAFGIYAAKGVMDYLAEKQIGYATPAGVVPIVPTAAIYDLNYKQPIPPQASDAYTACQNAEENNNQSGQVGAGTGATVGKLILDGKPMNGGLGKATITLGNGVMVEAYVVVNSVGDVRNAKDEIVAGACDQAGHFLNCQQYLLSGHIENRYFGDKTNSTLAAVFTNARFSKAELKRICKMAVSGIARAISPVFTRYDGDILFCISIGEKQATELTIGTMAAEAVRLAILDAVKDSQRI